MENKVRAGKLWPVLAELPQAKPGKTSTEQHRAAAHPGRQIHKVPAFKEGGVGTQAVSHTCMQRESMGLEYLSFLADSWILLF